MSTEALPQKKTSAAALPTLLFILFINLVGFGIVVPLLPFYAKSFHASAWQIALVFSAYAIGAFFGEPFWGRLSDRIGRKPILISTVCGNCLCYIAMAFAPNIVVAFVVRLMGGMASGNGSVVQGYIADVTPGEKRAGRLSLLRRRQQHGLHRRARARRIARTSVGRPHRFPHPAPRLRHAVRRFGAVDHPVREREPASLRALHASAEPLGCTR